MSKLNKIINLASILNGHNSLQKINPCLERLFCFIVIGFFMLMPFYTSLVFADNGSTTVPNISNIDYEVFDNEGRVVISFSTSIVSMGSVEYWTDSSDKMQKTFSPSHDDQKDYEVELTGLSDGTYIFRVKACNLASSTACRESDASYFLYGNDETLPPVDDIFCPEITNKRTVMVGGKTKPLSTIAVHTNENLRFTINVPASGLFSIENVPITTDESTDVKLVITDLSGNTNEKTCEIAFDGSVPDIVIEDFPKLTNQNYIELSLTTDKKVMLEIYNFLIDDNIPPGTPTDLVKVSSTDTKIVLRWTAPSDEDLSSFVIYRNNIPIAIVPKSQTSFEDEKIISGQQYNYRVRAVDIYCNVGALSSNIIIRAKDGSTFSEPYDEISNFCSEMSPYLKSEVTSDYSTPITLKKGTNKLILKAVDQAGNLFEQEFEVVMDDTKPTFLELNLKDFADGGTLSPYAVIRGIVSKPAYINITVNEGLVSERTYLMETSDDGFFQRQIDLARSWEALVSVDDGEDASASIGLDASSREWPNTVKITATDHMGNVVIETGVVNYMICDPGDGNHLRISFPSDSFSPTELIPHHILEGVAVIGFAYELDFRDHDGEIIDVRVNRMALSTSEHKRYNLNWIRDNPIPVIQSNDYGYVQVRLKADEPHPGESLLENENAIADTNKGRCVGSMISFGAETSEGSIFEYGCVKLPLVFEVQYRMPDGNEYTQKSCIDVSVMISPRYDPSALGPLFDATSSAIEWLADRADDIKEFLSLPRRVALISCVVSYALYYIYVFVENISCTLSLPYIGNFVFVPGENGYVISNRDDNPEQADRVQACYNARSITESLWQASKQVCRRVMCGSVPSFDLYVERQADNVFNPSTNPVQNLAMLDVQSSYCYNRHQVAQSSGRSVYAPDGEFPSDFLNAKLSHDDVVRHRFSYHEKAVASFLHESGVSWAEAMANHWCEEEYQYEYRPYCWMKNPYKESLCTAYNYVEDIPDHPLRNSVVENICKKNIFRRGADAIAQLGDNVGGICRADKDDDFGIIIGEDYYWIEQTADGKRVSLLKTEGRLFTARQESVGVFRVEDVDQELLSSFDKNEITLESFSNLPESCLSSDDLEIGGNYGACLKCASGVPGNECCPMISGTNKQIPTSIARHMCPIRDPSKSHVIDPTASIIDSAACWCVSSLYAQLDMMSRVMRSLSNCFKTIAETGDGSAGSCQQAISSYVCDTVYWAFGCFSNNFGSLGINMERKGDKLTLRDVTNAASSASDRASSRITGEYDGDQVFNNLFGEKTFFNTVCNFALFGEWPSNFFESALDAASDAVPIAPIVTCPGTRRYHSFNSVSGVASYIYDLGVDIFSGSPELQYKIELVCSTDQGSDCWYLGEERRLDITSRFSGNGRLGPRQDFNERELIIIDENTDAVNRGGLRYDKIIVTTNYVNNDGQPESRPNSCNLREVGGSPPAFCEFSPIDLKFSCTVVGQDGAVYFSREPEPKSNILYLGDGTQEVSFKPYSIRVQSRPGQEPPAASLRVRITDNNGNPVSWTSGRLGAGGRSYEIYRISSTDIANFGEGEDRSRDVPRFTVSGDFLRGSSGQCQLFNATHNQKSTFACNGIFNSIELTIGGGRLYATRGAYSVTDRTFTQEGVPHDVGFYAPGNIFDYNRDGVSFRLTLPPESDFPLRIVNLPELSTGISKLNIEFALLDESGAVIRTNRQQIVNTEILLSQGKREDDIERDDVIDDAISGHIGHNVPCTFGRCTCGSGSAVCNIGQKCCGRNSDIVSGIGYCIPGDQECDNLPPVFDDINVEIVSKSDSRVNLRIHNVKDESQTIAGRAKQIRIFMDLRRHISESSGTELPQLIEDDYRRDGSFTASVDAFEGISSNRYVVAFPPIPMRLTIPQTGCFDVFFSGYDSAGNIRESGLETGGLPYGVLLVGLDDAEFHKDRSCPYDPISFTMPMNPVQYESAMG